MEHTYWHKQSKDRPLFPDLLWSRPENKRQAGKLLVVGGNAHGFTAPAEAFTQAQKAGIGTVRVLLPDALEQTVKPLIPDALFASSTPSGSFARTALATLLDEAAWADGVLLAGDFGRNSETAVAIENFVQKYRGPLTITQDAINYLIETPGETQNREQTIFVLNIGQLQKFLQAIHWDEPATFSMGIPKLVELLHDFSAQHKVLIVTKLQQQFVVAAGGEISTIPTNIEEDDFWRLKTAASGSVWHLQNPTKPFEALTTALGVKDL